MTPKFLPVAAFVKSSAAPMIQRRPNQIPEIIPEDLLIIQGNSLESLGLYPSGIPSPKAKNRADRPKTA
jgi:hypothetical protein